MIHKGTKKRPDILSILCADDLLFVLLVGCFLAPHLAMWAMDAAAECAVEEDKPPVESVTVAPPIDCTPLMKSIRESQEAAQEDPYDESIPLSRELQEVLREACEANNFPLCDALGVIEVESNFQEDADNGVSIGLMQTNEKYASTFEEATGHSIYTPEGNIMGGVWYLGTLLDRYDGDTQAALRAYNRGYDDGDRRYARAVLDASEKWGCW